MGQKQRENGAGSQAERVGRVHRQGVHARNTVHRTPMFGGDRSMVKVRNAVARIIPGCTSRDVDERPALLARPEVCGAPKSLVEQGLSRVHALAMRLAL